MNEYLKEFLATKGERCHIEDRRCTDLRSNLVRDYSWSVPTDEAIALIAEYSPLVEIGAGSGYWAMLLRESGAKIMPFDINPSLGNEYKHYKTWTLIHKGTEEVLTRFSPKTNLFLSWSPYSEPLASNALKLFKGKFLIFIGECDGGCTGDEEFFKILDKARAQRLCVEIPRWDGIYDSLFVYERN